MQQQNSGLTPVLLKIHQKPRHLIRDNHVGLFVDFVCSCNSDIFFPHFSLELVGDLAKYDLEYVIGAGAFGQVIAATRKTDNVPVRIEKHHEMHVL